MTKSQFFFNESTHSMDGSVERKKKQTAAKKKKKASRR